MVCFNECSKELHDHVADPRPPSPGRPAKEDYEYTRHGTANLFVAVEPLAGTRHVAVTERRTIPDFAARMKHLCDVLYPDAAVICVVLDNLNTHALRSLASRLSSPHPTSRPRAGGRGSRPSARRCGSPRTPTEPRVTRCGTTW